MKPLWRKAEIFSQRYSGNSWRAPRVACWALPELSLVAFTLEKTNVMSQEAASISSMLIHASFIMLLTLAKKKTAGAGRPTDACHFPGSYGERAANTNVTRDTTGSADATAGAHASSHTDRVCDGHGRCLSSV